MLKGIGIFFVGACLLWFRLALACPKCDEAKAQQAKADSLQSPLKSFKQDFASSNSNVMKLIVFGDSNVDEGNYARLFEQQLGFNLQLPPMPATGGFNGGTPLPSLIASALTTQHGIPTQSYSYAIGSAIVAGPRAVGCDIQIPEICATDYPGFEQQVNLYFDDLPEPGRIPPDHVFLVVFTVNDLLWATESIASAEDWGLEVLKQLGSLTSVPWTYQEQVGRLVDAGAKVVFMTNYPPSEVAPIVRSMPQIAQLGLGSAVAGLNVGSQALARVMGFMHPGAKLVLLDLHNAITTAIEGAAAQGWNVMDPCLDLEGFKEAYFQPPNGVKQECNLELCGDGGKALLCKEPERNAFWDIMHMTQALHEKLVAILLPDMVPALRPQ